MSEEMNVEKTTGKAKQKKVMQVLGKVALWTLAVLVGLVGLILVWAFLSYPPAYLVRSIAWGESDVYDYQKFPSRPLAASSTPFYFKEEPAEAMVQALLHLKPRLALGSPFAATRSAITANTTLHV